MGPRLPQVADWGGGCREAWLAACTPRGHSQRTAQATPLALPLAPRRCHGDARTQARRVRGVPASGWRIRGSVAGRPRPGAGLAPREPAGLSAEDGVWASSSGQVSAARRRRRRRRVETWRACPVRSGLGWLGATGPHPSPSLIQTPVPRSIPEEVPQCQPFLPKCGLPPCPPREPLWEL